MDTIPYICDCGHAESPHSDFTHGYGKDAAGKTACYDCCAKKDRETMQETGRATLYLSDKDGKHEITNWPGSLRIPVRYLKIGRHNMAAKRYDAWFTGPDGKEWHGTQYGDNTQIIHCRRIKTA